MSINKKLRDEAIFHRVNVLDYESHVIKEALKLINKADKELTAKLYTVLDDFNPSNFQIKRLSSMLESVKSLDSFMNYVFGEVSEFSNYEYGYQYSLFDNLLPDIVKTKYPLMGISQEQLFATVKAKPFQGKLLKDWASSIEDDRLNRVINTVKNGYLLGETNGQIIQKVRGTKKAQYQDGVLAINHRNASSLIKTALSHTASVARDEFANKNKDILKGKQWLSTLDSGTTPCCIIRDKKQYTLDNKPIGHNISYGAGPGNIHFCCRSIYTYITKSWKELGINANELDKGTRASMDGQVSSDIEYQEWLKSQSPERQEKILGKERAKLLQEGKINPEKFFTENGRYLSLDELKEREGLIVSLSDAKTVGDVEKWMSGKVADYIKLPDSVSIDTAKDIANVSDDIISRFNLQKVARLESMANKPETIAGSYSISDKSIHVAEWALNQNEWDLITQNTIKANFKQMLSDQINGSIDENEQSKLLSNIEHVNYASIQSVKGTISHEIGHHLYYQYESDLLPLTTTAHQNKWGAVISVYATDSPKELFSESLVLYVLGDKNDHKRINPKILEWFIKHDKR